MPPDELLDHLCRLSRLDRGECNHLVREILAFYSETVEDFVARRHQELKREGLKNPEVFERLQHELAEHRFAAPDRSARQLRRIIYG